MMPGFGVFAGMPITPAHNATDRPPPKLVLSAANKLASSTLRCTEHLPAQCLRLSVEPGNLLADVRDIFRQRQPSVCFRSLGLSFRPFKLAAGDMMRSILLAVLAAGARLTRGCNHHGHDQDFTPEQLAELERKWGFEVCSSFCCVPFQLLIAPSCPSVAAS